MNSQQDCCIDVRMVTPATRFPQPGRSKMEYVVLYSSQILVS